MNIIFEEQSGKPPVKKTVAPAKTAREKNVDGKVPTDADWEERSQAEESVLTEQSAELDAEQKIAKGLSKMMATAEGSHAAGDASQATADTESLAADLSLAMSDVFSEDEESRLRNQHLHRMCRVCGSEHLHGGHFCPLCEYDLCADCSVVYCRLGHPLKIWTFPEATTLSCDMCKKAPIQAGYRCVVCDVDVCDMCTTQDSRNAFMLWPRRELKRILALLEGLREDSEIAQRYLDEQAALPPPKLHSMSVLCKKLKEVETIKLHVDEEIKLKKLRLRAKQYGKRGADM